MTARVVQALQLAGQGLRILPLSPHSKVPRKDDKWKTIASTEPTAILDWLAGTDNNYGVAAGCGVVVIDIDEKDGKQGWREFRDLGGTPTFTVRTPTGGAHAYYKTAETFTQRKISHGLDVRASGGYVVGPGSVTPDGVYEISDDREMQDLPEALRAKLRTLKSRPTAPAAAELDTPTDVHFARELLSTFEPAVEGFGGNDQTYKAITEARDRGVSEETCLDLALDVYNPRCSPPWAPEELQAIVRNVYSYAQRPVGSRSVTQRLAGLAEAVASVKAKPLTAGDMLARIQREAEGDLSFGSTLDEINPNWFPEWVFEGFLQLGEVTLLAAAGGTGKSALALGVAASAAAGRDFLGFSFGSGEPVRSLVSNNEDNLPTQYHRLHGASARRSLDFDLLRANILLDHPVDPQRRCLLVSNGFSVLPNDRLVEAYIARLKADAIRLLVLDTFSGLHEGEENRNDHMGKLVGLLRHIAAESHAAVLVNHHTPKFGGVAPGDTASARGASAITTGARYVYTLCPPTEDDLQMFRGEDPGQTRRRIRLDAAKMNHGEMRLEPTWLFRHTVALPFTSWRGDRLTTVCIDEPEHKVSAPSHTEIKRGIMSAVFDVLEQGTSASVSVSVLINVLPDMVPALVGRSAGDVRRLVQSAFIVPQTRGGLTAEFKQDRTQSFIVLVS